MSDDHIQHGILVISVTSVILSCTVSRIVTVHSKVMNLTHLISCTLPLLWCAFFGGYSNFPSSVSAVVSFRDSS